ncbi:uncharacterized protein LOC120672706 isoform X2 [Panicum virgatum]|uniref:uncharacterized protein LOC120672706 isoform X2 n=1 Tax=Panicum virgatum TaxID=38727 RepID=UPI0019D6A007|nr:uncharacterized protein LOC120672706 isoform X2 [Panicum virgatum]
MSSSRLGRGPAQAPPPWRGRSFPTHTHAPLDLPLLGAGEAADGTNGEGGAQGPCIDGRESLTEATSGAIGALVSTIVLYPLDTCKTKLQAELQTHQGMHKYRYMSVVDFRVRMAILSVLFNAGLKEALLHQNKVPCMSDNIDEQCKLLLDVNVQGCSEFKMLHILNDCSQACIKAFLLLQGNGRYSSKHSGSAAHTALLYLLF